MLLQFYFSNYRSFEGEATLDMRASGSNELSSHIRVQGNEKILPVSAIYGANASGKSSVFEAFEFMAWCVSNSLSFSKENKEKSQRLNIDSFKFSDKVKEPSEFEINYIDTNGKKELYYTYGFKIHKTDGTLNLDGAKFKLYDAATSGNEIKVVLVKTENGVNYYRVATASEQNSAVEIEAGMKILHIFFIENKMKNYI